MSHGSKRYTESRTMVDASKKYGLKEALTLLKQFKSARFDETVELAFRLGVDPRQSDQLVRGTVALPHGTGRKVRVLAFVRGPALEEAEAAGADFVGFEELVEKIQKGWTDFDVAVAMPELMKEVGKLGRVLGPRGLMPTPKTGTVTPEVGKAVREVKAGKVEVKVDKTANLHTAIGKTSFSEDKLYENAQAVYDAVIRMKPAAARGTYVRTCTVSSTMSPGIKLDLKSFKKKEEEE